MTTILTASANGNTVMCADQGVSSTVFHPNMRKIVQRGTWLVGCAGNLRFSDTLQHRVTYPIVPNELLDAPIEDWYAWVADVVIPRIDGALEQVAWSDIARETETLLVTHGRAFYIDENLGVSSASPYWAIGTGAEVALGAIYDRDKADDWRKNLDLHAIHAVRTAVALDVHSREPIDCFTSLSNGAIYTENTPFRK